MGETPHFNTITLIPFELVALAALQVRALLLIDSASIVSLNAAVLAGDIGIGGSGLAPSISAGSNIIFALCVITIVVLLCGFGWHAFRSAETEQVNIEVAQRAAAAAKFEAPKLLDRDADVRGISSGDARVTVLSHPVKSRRALDREVCDDLLQSVSQASAAPVLSSAAVAAAASRRPRNSMATFAPVATARRS